MVPDFGALDYIEGESSRVVHLAYTRTANGAGAGSGWGHWYAVCGRVAPGWPRRSLDDLDAPGPRLCSRCSARADRLAR